jgi:hypothetical protein
MTKSSRYFDHKPRYRKVPTSGLMKAPILRPERLEAMLDRAPAPAPLPLSAGAREALENMERARRLLEGGAS